MKGFHAVSGKLRLLEKNGLYFPDAGLGEDPSVVDDRSESPVPSRLRVRRLPVPVVVTFAVMAAAMTVYEVLKHVIVPEITIWGSHAVTVVFCSAIAAFLAFFIIYRRESLLIRLRCEVRNHRIMEADLRESELRYRSIIENIVDIYYRTDQTGRLIMMSPSGLNLLGYDSFGEIQGRDIAHVLYGNPYGHAVLQRALRENGGYVRDYEVVVRHRDGSEIPVSVSSRFYYNEQQEVMGVEGIFRDMRDRKRIEADREKLIQDLRDALSEVKALSGMLPICSCCKKIRNDEGYWEQIENYIRDHADVEFTHGICPECAKSLYPTVIRQGEVVLNGRC